MNRPSHWILGLLALLGGVLWLTGALQNYLSARPAGDAIGSGTRVGPAVVHRPGAGRDASVPRPTYSEVTGRVVDRLGFPVANAAVRVIGEDSDPVVTDARGRFRVTGSGAVHRRIRIEAPGVHEPVEVSGSIDRLDVVLQDATPWPRAESPAAPAIGLLAGEGTVRGVDGRLVAGVRVTVSGATVSGEIVRGTGASTLTDADGRYVLPLAGEACTLVAFDGLGGVAESGRIELPYPQGKMPLPELRLVLGPTLRGRLIATDGEPIVDASVIVETGGIQRVTRTEQGGLFSVAGLVVGDVELTVLPHRGHLGTRVSLLVERDANLPEVVLHRPRQEPLRLRVVDEAGVIQPFVHVIADQLAGLCRAYGQADSEGIVVLAGLGEGEIAFEVRDPALERIEVRGLDAPRRRLVVAAQ